MPKIKAYKGNGAIIPIDDAKLGTAYRCPWTGKVFSAKKSYVSHLKVLRENRMHSAIRARIRQRVFEDLISQGDFNRIIQWVETHPEFFFDRAVGSRLNAKKYIEEVRDKFWIKITYLDVRWNDSVSNSHNCPRGGVTCWSSREAEDGRPRGYPGWHGKIEFQLSHDLGFGSDVFRGLGIHTGTGGGTSDNRYGYDVKFFQSDWPGLEKFRMVSMLRDDSSSEFKYGKPHYFKW